MSDAEESGRTGLTEPAGPGPRPLAGRSVVVTRAREQSAELTRLLEEDGATVLAFPAIRFVPPESWESLDRAIDARPDWLVFTSTNGVASFFARLSERGLDANALAGVKVAAVGEVTADELRTRGLPPHAVPRRFTAAELLPFFAGDQRGVRTAVVRAAEGRDELIAELRRRGGEVGVAVAYRTVAGGFDVAELRERIARDSIDVLTFTSPSTVEHFFGPLTAGEESRLLARAAVVSIGGSTSEAIRGRGRVPDAVASSSTMPALRDAVVEAVRRMPART